MNDSIKLKIKGVQKSINAICERSSLGLTPTQVIVDMAQIVHNSLVCIAQETSIEIFQAEWLSVELSQYKNDKVSWDELNALAATFMEMAAELPPFTDVIELFGFGSKKLSKSLGQFLTPSIVATGVVKLPGFDLTKIAKGEHVNLYDCGGCGAGSLLLSILRLIYKEHPDSLNLVHVVGVDIDRKMVLLTSLQITVACLFHGIQLGSLRVHLGHGIIDYRHYMTDSDKTLSYVFTSDIDAMKAYLKQGTLTEEDF